MKYAKYVVLPALYLYFFLYIFGSFLFSELVFGLTETLSSKLESSDLLCMYHCIKLCPYLGAVQELFLYSVIFSFCFVCTPVNKILHHFIFTCTLHHNYWN